MFGKVLRWFFDRSVEAAIAALLASGAIASAVSYVVRLFVIPSWEAMWVIWTSSALGSYVVALRVARRWYPAERVTRHGELRVDFDPNAPRQFSPKTANELYDLARTDGMTRRALRAVLKPHIGLWLHIDAIATNINDEAGDDGEGGQWAIVRVDFKPASAPLLEMARPVYLYFFGADANVVRAMNEGDRIVAEGRIQSIDGSVFSGGIMLIPAVLVPGAPLVSSTVAT